MSNDDAISEQITRIRQKLQEVVAGRYRSLGCGRHDFRLRACANPGDLELFESLCHITLPEGYRRFVLEVGDGGAGPVYGLLPLATGLAYGPVTPDVIQKHFPYTQHTDPPRPGGQPEPRPGSVTLCDEGTNNRHFLVVTGPTRGQMWIDHTASSFGGYEPLGVDFLTWYERWLDSILAGGNGVWWRRPTPSS